MGDDDQEPGDEGLDDEPLPGLDDEPPVNLDDEPLPGLDDDPPVNLDDEPLPGLDEDYPDGYDDPLAAIGDEMLPEMPGDETSAPPSQANDQSDVDLDESPGWPRHRPHKRHRSHKRHRRHHDDEYMDYETQLERSRQQIAPVERKAESAPEQLSRYRQNPRLLVTALVAIGLVGIAVIIAVVALTSGGDGSTGDSSSDAAAVSDEQTAETDSEAAAGAEAATSGEADSAIGAETDTSTDQTDSSGAETDTGTTETDTEDVSVSADPRVSVDELLKLEILSISAPVPEDRMLSFTVELSGNWGQNPDVSQVNVAIRIANTNGEDLIAATGWNNGEAFTSDIDLRNTDDQSPFEVESEFSGNVLTMHVCLPDDYPFDLETTFFSGGLTVIVDPDSEPYSHTTTIFDFGG